MQTVHWVYCESSGDTGMAMLTQVMVDDVAVVVVLLKPAPLPSRSYRPPTIAHRAATTNALANGLDMMAARDVIANLPRQEFFKHLEKVSGIFHYILEEASHYGHSHKRHCPCAGQGRHSACTQLARCAKQSQR